MATPETLAPRLLALASGRPNSDAVAVNELLGRLLAAARAAWPTVPLDDLTYVTFLSERLPVDEDIALTLPQLRATDLYLACACARGTAGALLAFESAFFPDATMMIRRVSRDASFVSEILQILRTKLFVADTGPPRIAEYSGRGELRGWVRVVATREAVSALRRVRREVVTPDPLLEVAAGKAADPELAHLFARHATAFREAFVTAAGALTSEERNLLRYHYVDSLNIDHIGAIYQVHRVTASRRLNRARQRLIESTRTLLAERLALNASELESVLRLLQSELDVSVRRILGVVPVDDST